MKYLRTYPQGMQLLLFLLMAFVMLSVATVVRLAIPKMAGIPIESLMNISDKSSSTVIRAALWVQAIGSIMIFALTSLLFAYLAHPNPKRYLGLQAPKKPMHLLLAIVVMLGAMPIFLGIQTLMAQIDFGADVKKKQEAADAVFAAYLTMPTFLDFIRTFFVVAIVPAFSEELFFRGSIMRFTHKASGNTIVAVLFSAAMFAFVHASYTGLPSIFLAGILLAVIYNLTGSLWCGIMAHMFFNGSQVLLSYLGNNNPKITAMVNDTNTQYALLAGGIVVFALSFYALWKTRTPLPPNWSADFDAPQNAPEDKDLSTFS